MRRGWRLKQIIRLGSWLEGLRTWLAWDKNWISDRNPWHPSSKPGSWWFDDIQWHTSSLVGQLSPAKKFEIVGQEAVKSHLTIINTFRSGKPRIKGMERCRFCLSRSVLPTGERHHAHCLPLQQNNFFLTRWFITVDPSSTQDACQKWT